MKKTLTLGAIIALSFFGKTTFAQADHPQYQVPSCSPAQGEGYFAFYQGLDGTGTCVTLLANSYQYAINLKATSGTNDKIKSCVFVGPMAAGKQLFVYDNPDGQTDDDWTEVRLNAAIPAGGRVVIRGFEDNRNDNLIYVNHHHHNGLNGSISRLSPNTPQPF